MTLPSDYSRAGRALSAREGHDVPGEVRRLGRNLETALARLSKIPVELAGDYAGEAMSAGTVEEGLVVVAPLVEDGQRLVVIRAESPSKVLGARLTEQEAWLMLQTLGHARGIGDELARAILELDD